MNEAGAAIPVAAGSAAAGTAGEDGARPQYKRILLNLSGEPPMTRFLAAELATSHYFNISRARQDFGYDCQNVYQCRNTSRRNHRQTFIY